MCENTGKSYLGQTNSSEKLVSISSLHGLRAIRVSFERQYSFQQLNSVRQAALAQQKACQLVLTVSIAGQPVHHSSTGPAKDRPTQMTYVDLHGEIVSGAQMLGCQLCR